MNTTTTSTEHPGETVADRVAAAIVNSAADDTWQTRGACIGSPGLMDATLPREGVWDALAVCASCPVLDECRSWAQGEPDYVGVAGGRVWSHRTRDKLPSRRGRGRNGSTDKVLRVLRAAEDQAEGGAA